jgi:hypothetical protein
LPTIAYNHLPRWGQVGWTPAGENNSTKATLEWALISPAEVRITEARLAAETSGPSALRPYLILQLDVMVRGGDSLPGPSRLSYGAVYSVVEAMLATLWGEAGDVAAREFLRVPLGPPAVAELSIAGPFEKSRRSLTDLIDFAPAEPIPGSHGAISGAFTAALDRSLFDPLRRQKLALEWIEELGTTAGLNHVGAAIRRFARG